MYFLEYTSKQDKTCAAALSLRNNYRTFNKMPDLVRFLFDNAIFIEDYKIYDTELCKEKEHKGCISLDGNSAVLKFT